MERVVRGELTRAAAALVRGVSERQSVRLTARIRTEGGRGGIHGHRGRGSPPRARAAPPAPGRDGRRRGCCAKSRGARRTGGRVAGSV